MKLKMSKEVDLGKEPIGHLLFVLAVLSIISQVVNALYNMVDRMYIGHIPGEGAEKILGNCFSALVIQDQHDDCGDRSGDEYCSGSDLYFWI